MQTHNQVNNQRIQKLRHTLILCGSSGERANNKATLAGLTKTEMERSDLGFKAFKNVRGTTPYFEAKKKDLFAMIRQIGPPNIFFTKSVHETSMLPLIKSLQEKDKKKL